MSRRPGYLPGMTPAQEFAAAWAADPDWVLADTRDLLLYLARDDYARKRSSSYIQYERRAVIQMNWALQIMVIEGLGK